MRLPTTTTSTPTTIQASAPGSCVTLKTPKASTIVVGSVTIQARTISPTTLRLMPIPEATPAPATDEAAACVVEIGTPRPVAPKIEVTAPMLAATPDDACSVVIFRPMVSMIFQPPQTVPSAMAPYAENSTQVGTSMLPSAPGGEVAGADEQRGDDAHRLLRVVGAVAEGHRRRPTRAGAT